MHSNVPLVWKKKRRQLNYYFWQLITVLFISYFTIQGQNTCKSRENYKKGLTTKHVCFQIVLHVWYSTADTAAAWDSSDDLIPLLIHTVLEAPLKLRTTHSILSLVFVFEALQKVHLCYNIADKFGSDGLIPCLYIFEACTSYMWFILCGKYRKSG